MRKQRNFGQTTILGLEPWQGYLSEGKISLLKKTWAHTFLTYILPKLPVRELSQFYSSNLGRPTKNLTTALGVCILQQIFDLTDNETRNELAFNQQWHYALDTFDPKEQLYSEKTLWTVRQHLSSNDAGHCIFDLITDNFIDEFNVDTSKQRMDSVHVNSNMARLGRVRLMLATNRKFLKNLQRGFSVKFNNLPEYFTERYMRENANSYFGNVKPSGSANRLIEIANDMQHLIEEYSGDNDVTNMYSYKLLLRVISEQCDVKEKKVKMKSPKEISSSSIQNPSDIDAGYDGHKGQGFQTQLVETYHKKEENKDKKEKPVLDLITYTKTESADKHDGHALQPAIDNLDERNNKPDELLADTHYGDDANVTQAKEKGILIIAPVAGKKTDKDYTNFHFELDTFNVIKCPNGHSPMNINRKKNNEITAEWHKKYCDKCPLKDKCITNKSKKGRKLKYTEKIIRLSIRRTYQESDDFKDKYRYRAGIEATNSRFIHQTGARRVRYRGGERIDFAETMKSLGINMFRVAKYLDKLAKFSPKTATHLKNTIIFAICKHFKCKIKEFERHLFKYATFRKYLCNFE